MDAGLRRLLMLVALMVMVDASAEVLPDPTRPAIDLDAPEGAAAEGGRPAVQQASGLHSIIISPLFRGAIINGKTVRQGESYGGAKLVEVHENWIVLESAKGRRVMELFPSVNIKKNRAERPVTGGETEEDTPGGSDQPDKVAGEKR
jgi:MSHA biogenesis protein MshK